MQPSTNHLVHLTFHFQWRRESKLERRGEGRESHRHLREMTKTLRGSLRHNRRHSQTHTSQSLGQEQHDVQQKRRTNRRTDLLMCWLVFITSTTSNRSPAPTYKTANSLCVAVVANNQYPLQLISSYKAWILSLWMSVQKKFLHLLICFQKCTLKIGDKQIKNVLTKHRLHLM